MGNDKLKWETSEQTDLGIDALLFAGRMNFSMDYFVKKTKDLLVSGTTPSLVIGGTTSPINAGNVSNKGFEFEEARTTALLAAAITDFTLVVKSPAHWDGICCVIVEVHCVKRCDGDRKSVV